MVFFEECVCVEYVVLEGLDVAAIESNKAISPHDIHTRRHNAVCAGYVCTETTEIGWCFL